jgi:hypothetical protein
MTLLDRLLGRADDVPVIDVHRAAGVRRWVFIYDVIMSAVLGFLAWSYFQPSGQP